MKTIVRAGFLALLAMLSGNAVAEPPIDIYIGTDGFLWNDQPVATLAELKVHLINVQPEHFRIRASPDAPYDRVASVIQIMKELGIENTEFVGAMAPE